MRLLCLTAVLLLAGPAAADPAPRSKARAEAAAALALASSCDCKPGEAPRCGEVGAVLAKVCRDIDAEGKAPAVAPMPREKKAAPKCDCDGGECVGLCPGCACKPAPASPAAVPAVMPAAPACVLIPLYDRSGRVVGYRQQCPAR